MNVIVPAEVREAATTAYAKRFTTCLDTKCIDPFGHARLAAVDVAYRAGIDAAHARMKRS